MELKNELYAVIEREKGLIEGRLLEFSDLMHRINKTGVYSVNLWMEGWESDSSFKGIRDSLSLLERAGLVEIVTKFTHRNAALEAHLTDKGKDLLKKL